MDTTALSLDLTSYRLIEGDVIDALDDVEDGSCKLILASPPYNVGKEYEKDAKKSLDEYLGEFDSILDKMANKVTSDGHICWQVGNFVEKFEVFPLDIFFYEKFKKIGFKLRNRIIWHYNFGLNAQNRFSGRYETILWFSKGDDYTFNLDSVRVPQLYPGKRHPASKGERAGRPSGNPKGKNPSDFWIFNPEEAFLVNPIWDIPNVKANHAEKTEHPCQFPLELVERCVLALTNAGDFVLDPFAGAGSTLLGANIHGRPAIGIERDKGYIQLAHRRMLQLAQGILPRRPFGKPVREPESGEKVARVPSEWLEAVAVEGGDGGETI